MKVVVYICVITVVCFLTSCTKNFGTSANTENMIVFSNDKYIHESQSSKFYNNISTITVVGGQKPNPLLSAMVTNKNLHDAIEKSLIKYKYISDTNAPKYKLDVELIKMDHPFIGLELTVKSVINYNISEISTNKQVFSKIISSSSISKFSTDHKRLQKAKESSVRSNIKLFIDELSKIKLAEL